jgi:hypothetical protein
MADKSKWRINQNGDFIYKFFDMLKFFFSLILTFYDTKIKPMLPIIKFQNGAQIQDGRQNVFIN